MSSSHSLNSSGKEPGKTLARERSRNTYGDGGNSAPATALQTWTFFTNHSHVLICLAKDSKLTLRRVAELVGITERAVQKIVSDLEAAKVLSHTRKGRQNVYRVHLNHPLRHPVESHCSVADVVNLLVSKH